MSDAFVGIDIGKFKFGVAVLSPQICGYKAAASSKIGE